MPLPQILIDAFENKTVFGKGGTAHSLAGNITLSEADLLYSIIKILKPQRSLEIGFGQGISSLAILQALKENGTGSHHVLDPFQSDYDYAGIEMVNRAGLSDYLTFHEDFAENIIPGLGDIDFTFIDSSHLFDLTMLDFIFTDRKLRKGGVIGFHDLDFPALRKLIKYILANRSYEILRLPQLEPIYRLNIMSEFYSLRSLLRRLYNESKKPISLMVYGNIIFLKKIG
ncbi:MAG: hypothetical protein QG635_360 [Bacteroidota bacterium]|nr:hypothetical protein [Bacteroidota bacterium]